MPSELVFRHALVGEGVTSDCAIVVGDGGVIEEIRPALRGGTRDGFLALPGIPNAHSHAFQRALAGRGESSRGQDSFWSWREAMYALANRLDPDDLFSIARLAFAEMLAAGFTSVAEFHYLHHLPDGQRTAAMGNAIVEAARAAGIHLVLVPVLYQTGGFGEPFRPEQKRFVHESVDDYLTLVERFRHVPLGIAAHSLRAVPADALPRLVTQARALLGPAVPIHLHVAEQSAEVAACQAAHGCGPVELLARTVDLDRHWTLVHATHASSSEIALARAADANIVICPLTEGALGDGLFDAGAWAPRSLAIGSDGNARLDAVEELRWLEYGQRLRTQRRSILASAGGLGIPLWTSAVAAGARALGQPVGGIAVGQRADLVVIPEDANMLAGHDPATALDALVINGNRADIGDVYVGGRRVVTQGRHREDRAIRADFHRVVRSLFAG